MSGRTSKRPWLIAMTLGVMALGQTGLSLAVEKSLSPMKVDARKAELGKRLFFDARLSGDVALSCSSYHQPEKGFANAEALSPAYPGSKGFRNAPSLINTTYKKRPFRRLADHFRDSCLIFRYRYSRSL